MRFTGSLYTFSYGEMGNFQEIELRNIKIKIMEVWKEEDIIKAYELGTIKN